MQKEKLENNLVLKLFKEGFGEAYPQLVGGAVIDILEDRVPKDYDFIFTNILKEKLDKVAEFQYVSQTSYTYKYNDFVIQLIRKGVNNFPFLIEKATFNIQTSSLYNLDEVSFKSKVLIPSAITNSVDKNYGENKSATEALMRIPHWQRKGYKINDVTYQTLIKIATKRTEDEKS